MYVGRLPARRARWVVQHDARVWQRVPLALHIRLPVRQPNLTAVPPSVAVSLLKLAPIPCLAQHLPQGQCSHEGLGKHRRDCLHKRCPFRLIRRERESCMLIRLRLRIPSFQQLGGSRSCPCSRQSLQCPHRCQCTSWCQTLLSRAPPAPRQHLSVSACEVKMAFLLCMSRNLAIQPSPQVLTEHKKQEEQEACIILYQLLPYIHINLG